MLLKECAVTTYVLFPSSSVIPDGPCVPFCSADTLLKGSIITKAENIVDVVINIPKNRDTVFVISLFLDNILKEKIKYIWNKYNH